MMDIKRAFTLPSESHFPLAMDAYIEEAILSASRAQREAAEKLGVQLDPMTRRPR